MASIEVTCRKCKESQGVIRNGKAPTDIQRFYCQDCQYSFQLKYRDNANPPNTHERISKMAMNDSDIRDASCVLEISPTTVISHLKN